MMMDFTFTEEQRMMASTFRELLEEICSPRRLRATAEGSGDRAATERLAREPPAGASEGIPSGGDRVVARLTMLAPF
jgi:hypothetical protein